MQMGTLGRQTFFLDDEQSGLSCSHTLRSHAHTILLFFLFLSSERGYQDARRTGFFLKSSLCPPFQTAVEPRRAEEVLGGGGYLGSGTRGLWVIMTWLLAPPATDAGLSSSLPWDQLGSMGSDCLWTLGRRQGV